MERPISTRRADGWIETEATIISCKQTLGSWLSSGVIRSDGYDQAPDYTVVFRYTVAQQAFTGKYQVHSEQAIGSTVTIAYDPRRPMRNTGTDLVYKPWVKVLAWALATGGVALAIHFGLRLPDYYQPF